MQFLQRAFLSLVEQGLKEEKKAATVVMNTSKNVSRVIHCVFFDFRLLRKQIDQFIWMKMIKMLWEILLPNLPV